MEDCTILDSGRHTLCVEFASLCLLLVSTLAEARPRWATLHPDNWTVLEVAEWLDTVAEEYGLGHGVKAVLSRAFCDVDGDRLTAMTLDDFLDLDPHHGNLVFSVFHRMTPAGQFGSGRDHHPPQGPGEPVQPPRTLTPIAEHLQQQQRQQQDCSLPTGTRPLPGMPGSTRGQGLQGAGPPQSGPVAGGRASQGRSRHSSLPCPSRGDPPNVPESQQQRRQTTGRQPCGPPSYNRSQSS